MSYYIDIIDTVSPDTKLVIEYASASGIVLEWSGSDAKDELVIVGSNLQFDMLSTDVKDLAFIEFFTGDEHRFKVLVKNSENDAVIWQGYILPDMYSEPYKNGCFFVNFAATDGLGRLKGKYLPEQYYSREKSLIDIYVQLLLLTGLEMDLYFNPAIENFLNKDWNTIYIDTVTFLKKDKKQDAYSILETLLQDTLCVCYQADNRWYIEGINTRQIRRVTYKKYGTDGVLSGYITYDRLLKRITPLITPTITMIPPYNEITVSHEKTDSIFPETIDKEENDGWVVENGLVATIYSTDWIGNNGMLEYCAAPNYKIELPHRLVSRPRRGTEFNASSAPLGTHFISLRNKIYMNKGKRVNMFFAFSIEKANTNIETPELLLWKNIFKYEIVFNGVLLYTNFGDSVAYYEDLNFNESLKAELSFDYIFKEEGLLDVRIYELAIPVETTNIDNVILDKAKIETFGFQEVEIYTDLINGDYTIDKNIELVYADDKSGRSLAFRLEKLKEATTFFSAIDVPVLHRFIMNGKYYNVVHISGANLIKENVYQVYSDTMAPVTVINVVYNLNDGEQMVVETPSAYVGSKFVVKKYAINDVVSSRSHWDQWTDIFYKIEKTTFAKTIANIYRRMFSGPTEKLDVVALDSVKFNDLISFKYVFLKDFFVINCSWNLDENKTTLTLARAIYQDVPIDVPEDENIPPIVVAADDIYLIGGQSSADISATAYDPDGYIVSRLWEKTSGPVGDIIAQNGQLISAVSGLVGDSYTYKITVTDNDGATAFDFMNIYRIKNHNISLNLIETTNTQALSNFYLEKIYNLLIDPAINDNVVLAISGSIHVEIALRNPVDSAYARCAITKNGVLIGYLSTDVNGDLKDINFSFNVISTDIVTFRLTTRIKNHAANLALVNLKIGSVIVSQGNATITGVPIVQNQSVGTI